MILMLLFGIYLTGFIAGGVMVWVSGVLGGSSTTQFGFWIEILITASFWPVILVMLIKDLKK